jgi:hypothetical protein
MRARAPDISEIVSSTTRLKCLIGCNLVFTLAVLWRVFA